MESSVEKLSEPYYCDLCGRTHFKLKPSLKCRKIEALDWVVVENKGHEFVVNKYSFDRMKPLRIANPKNAASLNYLKLKYMDKPYRYPRRNRVGG